MVVQSLLSQLEGRNHPVDRKINLGDCETINALMTCFYCKMLDDFTSIGFRLVIELKYLRSFGGKSVFGGTAEPNTLRSTGLIFSNAMYFLSLRHALNVKFYFEKLLVMFAAQ